MARQPKAQAPFIPGPNEAADLLLDEQGSTGRSGVAKDLYSPGSGVGIVTSEHRPSSPEGENLYDDLYEDVGDTLLYKAPFPSLHENDAREEELKKKEADLRGKVESLLKEVEALQQDKAVLTRNISCLFKTAQMELARKDKQMKELRDENSKLKLGGTQGLTNMRPHVTKAVVPTEKTNVELDSSEQANTRRVERAIGVSANVHDGHRQISAEEKKGRSPSRGQHKDRIPDSSRDEKSSSYNHSGSDRRREFGRSEHGSRERSRDPRELRDSDSRKRYRR